MDFFNLSFWQNFVSSGLATLAGVIIGIPVALWIGRLQERATEKEKKKKILNSLKDELHYSEYELGRVIERETLKNECGVLGSLLRNELWKAYSDGGDLQWIKDMELLANIADSYYMIRAIMELSDKYYNSVQFATEEASPVRIGMIFITLQATVDMGLRSIQKTIREMDKHLL